MTDQMVTGNRHDGHHGMTDQMVTGNRHDGQSWYDRSNGYR